MEDMRIISVVNFVRGGKSSIARLLAEKANTSILNFDPKRNGEFYNAVITNNIPDNAKITRNKNSIEIEADTEIITLKSSSNMFICDFGGRFDERINEFKSDIYILPMQDDFESINETVRATKYILSKNRDANIIHVLNMYGCTTKKKKETFESEYKELMILNGLKDITYHIMPSSELIKKIVNNRMKITEIIGNSKFLENGAYKNILTFVDDLIKTINRREK
jgi:hypothetical protein